MIRTLPYLLLLLLASACQFQKSVPEISSMDELEYPYPTSKAQLSDGIEIAYMDQGQGEKTLLMVHGLGSYGPAWKQNMAALSQKNRCIAIDLPGYGKSSKGRYEGGMRFFADVVKEFVDGMGLENVVLMGHSMGGQIALTASLAYPETFQELVLVSPAGFETFHPGQRKWFGEVITARGVYLTPVDQIKANIGWNFYKMPKEAEFMVTDRIAMRKCKEFEGYCYIIPVCVQGMVDDPVFDHLKDVQARTLVVFGAQDNLIPNRFLNPGTTKKIAEQGAEQMPNATLELVNKAGHFVHFEKADVVNGYIMDFLSAGK